MFKPTSKVCSALTKRTNKVKVQILKDFPKFQFYTGEVVDVKPSLMINYLHNNNGARYILNQKDLDQELLQKYVVNARKTLKKIVKRSSPTKDHQEANKSKKIVENKKTMKANTKDGIKKETRNTSVSAINAKVNIRNIKIPGLKN